MCKRLKNRDLILCICLYHSPALSCLLIYIYTYMYTHIYIYTHIYSSPRAFGSSIIMWLWLIPGRVSSSVSFIPVVNVPSACPEAVPALLFSSIIAWQRRVSQIPHGRLKSARVNDTSFVHLRVRFDIITSSATSTRVLDVSSRLWKFLLAFPLIKVSHWNRFSKSLHLPSV